MFTTIHAAGLAHVEPWALAAQSLRWRNWILAKANIEAEATKEQHKRAERNRLRQGRRR